ncbi:uncharacterized protein [Periplaneta americana]|uniref:uncharacterized protein n=1 Tax=Periplaneta americana TaxID=6978 RepID=UPI0037E7A5E3
MPGHIRELLSSRANSHFRLAVLRALSGEYILPKLVLNMTFFIQSLNTRLYAEVHESKKEPGTAVVMGRFTGLKNQQWSYRRTMIESALNGLVMDIEKGGQRIVMAKPTEEATQKWFFDDDCTVRNRVEHKVLDVPKTARDNGAAVEVHEKDKDRESQKFRIQPTNEL